MYPLAAAAGRDPTAGYPACTVTTGRGEHVAHRTHGGETHRFERLSRLGHFDVEQGDVDPRGWSVITPNGEALGEVKDLIIDTERMRGTYLDVELDTKQFDLRGDPHVHVPVERAHRDRNHRRLIVDGLGRDRVLDLVTAREAAATSFWDDWWGRHHATDAHTHTHEPPHVDTRVDPPADRRPEQARVQARVRDSIAGRDPIVGADIDRTVDRVAPGQKVRIPMGREEIVIERRPVDAVDHLADRLDERPGDRLADRMIAREDDLRDRDRR